MFLHFGWPLLRVDGLFCNLDFFLFWVNKALDTDWIRIGSVFSLMLDPDPEPDEMNVDPQLCLYDQHRICQRYGSGSGSRSFYY
jgi:hypothetical protein